MNRREAIETGLLMTGVVAAMVGTAVLLTRLGLEAELSVVGSTAGVLGTAFTIARELQSLRGSAGRDADASTASASNLRDGATAREYAASLEAADWRATTIDGSSPFALRLLQSTHERIVEHVPGADRWLRWTRPLGITAALVAYLWLVLGLLGLVGTVAALPTAVEPVVGVVAPVPFPPTAWTALYLLVPVALIASVVYAEDLRRRSTCPTCRRPFALEEPADSENPDVSSTERRVTRCVHDDCDGHRFRDTGR